MASEFKQRICNARDLAATLTQLEAEYSGGLFAGNPWIIRLEDNDDVLICWYQADEDDDDGIS